MTDRPIKIIGATMCTSRRFESAPTVNKILPYVDKMIIVDGGSGEDESVVYFRNLQKRFPDKIEFYVNFFSYHFVEQRNFYLDKAKKHLSESEDIWVLVFDSDEPPTLGFLHNMRTIIKQAEELRGANIVALKCRSVWTMGGEVIRKTRDDFFKISLFKLYPETHYEGSGHESLSQPNFTVVCCGNEKDNQTIEDTEDQIMYENWKEVDGSVWIRGARNFCSWGGSKNIHEKNPYYVEWKTLISPYFENKYPPFDVILKWFAKGNLPNDVKNWLLNRARVCKELWPGYSDGASEVREVSKVYYILYRPEEIPEGLSEKDFE